MRAYFTLLRLPYQLQLGPIFGWGFLLGGGRWTNAREICTSLAIFLLFHVGAFGGLTALNSYYDRDCGPVGGLWNPPEVPRCLWLFAWCVQLGGLVLLVSFGFKLCVIYALILILSLGYSHPRTRWKASPLGSLFVVVIGQGALSFGAGALAAEKVRPYSGVLLSLIWGALGAMSFVAALYPLTQLYQIESDRARGEHTFASWLQSRFERRGIFCTSAIFFILGGICNFYAVRTSALAREALLQLLFPLAACAFLVCWRRAEREQKGDFLQVHRLLRLVAYGFGAYIVAQLIFGRP